jgi:hypothetical protein
MEEQINAQCETDKFEKIKKYQLPNHFKKIGFGIFILSFIAMFIVAFTINDPQLRQFTKYGILFGLLIISISKEKIEDEYIIKIRMQSYTIAFIIGVAYALVLPFVDFLVDYFLKEDAQLKDMGDFMILWMLLFVQVLFFHLLKRR